MPGIARKKGDVTENEPGRCKDVTGAERIAQVVMVDQSPPSRTPRSTPAVYVGAYDWIRQIFAGTPDAEAQELGAGFFSFNSGTGRCGRHQERAPHVRVDVPELAGRKRCQNTVPRLLRPSRTPVRLTRSGESEMN